MRLWYAVERRQREQYGFAAGKEVLLECRRACSRLPPQAGAGKRDSFFVPADSTPLTSTREVIDYYKRSFADKWFSLDCEQEKVEISESGEMAWAHGICNATFTGPDGK